MSHAAHDLEALRLKSRIDEITGCWNVMAATYKGTVMLWCPPAGCSLSLTACMAWLMTGKPAPKGKLWVPMCGNTACGNPAHRKLGTRSDLMKIIRPRLSLLHRARIQAGHLRRVKHYSPGLRAEIMQSDESCAQQARRLGMKPGTVRDVRHGRTWNPVASAASAFGSVGRT